MINDKQTYQDLDLCGFSFARYHREVFHLPACLPACQEQGDAMFESLRWEGEGWECTNMVAVK